MLRDYVSLEIAKKKKAVYFQSNSKWVLSVSRVDSRYPGRKRNNLVKLLVKLVVILV